MWHANKRDEEPREDKTTERLKGSTDSPKAVLYSFVEKK